MEVQVVHLVLLAILWPGVIVHARTAIAKPAIRPLWGFLCCYAVSATFSPLAWNEDLTVPGVPRWVWVLASHVALLLAVACVRRFFSPGPNGRRWLIVAAATQPAALIVLAVLDPRHLTEPPSPGVAVAMAYWLVYWAVLSWTDLRVAWAATTAGLRDQAHPAIRAVGLTLAALGGFACVVGVITMVRIATVPFSGDLAVLFPQDTFFGMELTFLTAATLGATVSVLLTPLQWLADRWALRRMAPLYTAVVAAYPELVITGYDGSRGRFFAAGHERLYRQAVTISDALADLAATYGWLRARAREELSGVEAEAAWVAAALALRGGAAPAEDAPGPQDDPHELGPVPPEALSVRGAGDEIRRLSHVSRAFATSSGVTAFVARHTRPKEIRI
ncbi:DUF6545 domain-containing protein [Nonomuraea jiangxiensis]|uniref:DUF6545 domain-containing protein n=1 Tax=Nonomuraea jiangxiensis TaxID=633440 RepID=A0A1G8I842_9ACTN|nr:DUF6545 domain-containing protein [Nonomuraea jiangxiensis]SDI15128.1 hypothetical protein SAMN05421869_104408 [Nonomuraea jiangxiensis]